MPETEPSDLITIGHCSSDIEAKIIRSFLEDSDIDCFIKGENHHQLLGFMGSYIAMEIMVSSSQAVEARKLLVEYFENQKNEVPEDIETTKDDAHTPSKQPQFLTQKKKSLGLGLLLALFVTFGAGQLYLGRYFTFAILALTELLGFIFLVLGANDTVRFLIFAPVVVDVLLTLLNLTNSFSQTDRPPGDFRRTGR